ncbi:hypothetical protein [Pseudomonas putida]|uniref:hypothetical protein n=1 Tax=Pseudomonas putida TaxID=303 RepID=UPI0007B7FAAA|nr:hypothetical protein [Pseudomonas putida]
MSKDALQISMYDYLVKIRATLSRLGEGLDNQSVSIEGINRLSELERSVLTMLDAPEVRIDEHRLPLFQQIAMDTVACATEFATHIDDRLQSLGKDLSNFGIGLMQLATQASVQMVRSRAERTGLESFQVTPNEAFREQQAHISQVSHMLKESEFRASELKSQFAELKLVADGEIEKITAAYAAAVIDIDQKTEHINRVTGQAAARMIAGDYEGSAASEKEAADYLRLGALACMLLIVAILGWALYETTGAIFEWDRFLSKISLVFLLGVPAAYLARESAKHREQQYQHLQTSLDMKAISPFLASMPDEEQHKLKAIIATRIFGGRDFSKVGNDPYPINTHEILMKIIDKLDLSTSKPVMAKKVQPALGATAASEPST